MTRKLLGGLFHPRQTLSYEKEYLVNPLRYGRPDENSSPSPGTRKFATTQFFFFFQGKLILKRSSDSFASEKARKANLKLPWTLVRYTYMLINVY